MHIKSRIDGFTLVELLVVITIIGVLGSIVLVSVNSARKKAQEVTIKSLKKEYFKNVGYAIQMNDKEGGSYSRDQVGNFLNDPNNPITRPISTLWNGSIYWNLRKYNIHSNWTLVGNTPSSEERYVVYFMAWPSYSNIECMESARGADKVYNALDNGTLYTVTNFYKPVYRGGALIGYDCNH